MKKVFLLIQTILGCLIIFTLPACLKTRDNVEQRQVLQQQTTSLQKATADTGSRLSDVEEQIRFLNGRVEVVENKQSNGNSGVESAMKTAQLHQNESNQKMNLMQEALTKLESQIFQLTAEVQALKAEKANAQTAVAHAAKQNQKEPFESAEDYFSQKDWKKAALNYQKYRDDNPKGKHIPEATYKMGVCFQELGMKDEAKTIYEEVLGKFPKSDQARKSKTRLKAFKK